MPNLEGVLSFGPGLMVQFPGAGSPPLPAGPLTMHYHPPLEVVLYLTPTHSRNSCSSHLTTIKEAERGWRKSRTISGKHQVMSLKSLPLDQTCLSLRNARADLTNQSGVWSFPISCRPVLGNPEDLNVNLRGEDVHPPRTRQPPTPGEGVNIRTIPNSLSQKA